MSVSSLEKRDNCNCNVHKFMMCFNICFNMLGGQVVNYYLSLCVCVLSVEVGGGLRELTSVIFFNLNGGVRLFINTTGGMGHLFRGGCWNTLYLNDINCTTLSHRPVHVVC
jgi:hypothetical protein